MAISFLSKPQPPEITITVYAAPSRVTPGFIFCDNERAGLIDIAGDEINVHQIERHQAKFRRPGPFEKYSDDLADVVERVSQFLTSWTITDDRGKPIPPTRENIEQVNPTVLMVFDVHFRLTLSGRR